jgi:hypothetical protein
MLLGPCVSKESSSEGRNWANPPIPFHRSSPEFFRLGLSLSPIVVIDPSASIKVSRCISRTSYCIIPWSVAILHSRSACGTAVHGRRRHSGDHFVAGLLSVASSPSTHSSALNRSPQRFLDRRLR